MKTIIAILSLSALFAWHTLPAQPPSAAVAEAIAQRFKEYDKNGDGKLTRNEVPSSWPFDEWDANKDGVVTLEEVTAYYLRLHARDREINKPSAEPKTGRKPPLTSLSRGSTKDFEPDAPFVGEVNGYGSYIDPEFCEGTNQVVFQDAQNRVWIGDLDPETGLFKTATGRDYLVDDNITIIFDRPRQGRKFSTNGPEWTKDNQGYCVVYTKEDKAGLMQQWLGRIVNGKPVVKQLTTQKMDCYGNMPSRFEDGKPPRIAFTYDWPIWKARAAWIFADRPDELHPVPGFDYNKMSMWSPVSADFLFVHRPQGAIRGQIGRANADTGKITILTNDEGDKDDPGMFRAPEFGGEICLMANVDNRAIAIYRNLKSPDGYWTRVATLNLPADAPYKFISSPELIAPATGIGGVSYVALLARESKDRNSLGSIWVLGLGKDPAKRLIRRVDDGAVTGVPAALLEPEPFVGKNESYVYYNYYGRGVGSKRGLRRASTGLKVEAVSTAVCKTGAPDAKLFLVLICIDGCRPDYLEFSDIPSINKLQGEGITYDQAWVGQLRNDTPPGHVTLATGVFPRSHGVIGFHWRDPDKGTQFKPTTWFGVARGQLNQLIADSGCPSIRSTYRKISPGAKVAALSSDKFYAAAALGADCADFIGYCRYEPRRGFGTSVGLTLVPETVTGRQVPPAIMNSLDLKHKVANPWDGDTWTVDFALQLLAREKPEILLLNLALADDVGHTYGANHGKEQMTQIINNVDRQVGRIVDAYRQAGIYDRTLFVITSDHGMSANLHTIDETPMAPTVTKFGMERSAARLEFYVKDPARAREAAQEIDHLKLKGIHAIYYKDRDPKGSYHYLPAPGTRIEAWLDACYRYLSSTYASAQCPDLVCFAAENWNINEASSYFKGDHGTITWDNQHVPLIIAGPGIKKGATSHVPARLVDIAPTILAAMGLKPERMDGVVLADALQAPADMYVGLQQTVTKQLTPLRNALKNRHVQDVGNDRVAADTPARLATPPATSKVSKQMLEMFRRFDRNGDGKVTREEAGNAPWFDWLDRNRDGVITLEELEQAGPGIGQRPGRSKPPAGTAVAPSSGPKLPPGPSKTTEIPSTGTIQAPAKVPFVFSRDYTPGTKDSKGQNLTGQELMRIVSYRGELFAGTSTFTDPRAYTRDPNYTGCQVLRKASPRSGWEADVSFGRRYLRTDCLQEVRFTQDAGGKPLAEPVGMLVAGIWDVGETGQRPAGSGDVASREDVNRDVAKKIFGRDFGKAGVTGRVTGLNRHITVAIRDDTTGKWTISQVARVPDGERGFASVRAMIVHRDQVTGQECLFVGAACGGMFKGVYDSSVPGRIRWVGRDELDSSFGRVHSMCICNGVLYASTDYGGLTVQKQRGGIFKRIDGANPTWERVYFHYDPKYPTWNQTGRGITTVPAEDGTGKEVILVGIEWPPEPIVVRIEPHRGHRAVTEVNYHDYFAKVFGKPPQILGGSKQIPHAGCECAALNYFEPFSNPQTGKTERFVTLFLIHPDDPAESSNGAYFLIRRAPGVYDWGEIPSGLPTGQHLRGTRTIEKSPFPDEPNVWYFGGCFNGPDEQPPKPNMAWIFKGSLEPTKGNPGTRH